MGDDVSYTKQELEEFRDRARYLHWRRILGEETVEDQWPLSWYRESTVWRGARPFHIRPDVFLRVASENPPVNRQPTVSAFSHWIHSLYASESDKVTLNKAKLAEAEIFAIRSRRARWVMNLTEVPPKSGWKIEHCGLIGNLNLRMHAAVGVPFFEIESLLVDGLPLKASPDLIFVNSSTNESIVVEIKFSNKYLPSNLWPDLWAQLWAYTKIPQLAMSSRISIVGEVWGEYKDFDRFFSRLFEIYSS